MLRERVSDDIYVFTSDLYAQVTAGLVIGPEGAAVIDTLPFPSETREVLAFLREKAGVPVRYVINTHYHADHCYGNYLFGEAEVIAHEKCRTLLDGRGRKALERAKTQAPELAPVEIILPETVFAQGTVEVHVGEKTLELSRSPGHSPDSITVLVKEDRIMFAGDTVMPLPHIVDGDLDDMRRSLEILPPLGLENIVQGHGEVILRGEIDDAVKSNLKYLDAIRKKVQQAIRRKKPREWVKTIDIQECGKSRIPLAGQVVALHTANLLALYDRMSKN